MKNFPPYNGETFFIQTVEHSKTIYKGDIAVIPIPGLEGYFADFVVDRKNISFTAEFIEAKPKPELPLCKKLKELEEKHLNKKENRQH